MFDNYDESAGLRHGEVKMRKGVPFAFDRQLKNGEELDLSSFWTSGNFKHGKIVKRKNGGWFFEQSGMGLQQIELDDKMDVRKMAHYEFCKITADGDNLTVFDAPIKIGQVIEVEITTRYEYPSSMNLKGKVIARWTSGEVVRIKDKLKLRVQGQQDTLELEGLVTRKIVV